MGKNKRVKAPPMKIEKPRAKVAWDMQEYETKKGFDAFCIYRDAGAARSLEKVRQVLGCSAPNVERWSRKNKWVDRVRQYDMHVASKRTIKLEDEVERMNKQHIALVSNLRSALSAPIQVMLKTLKEKIDPITGAVDLGGFNKMGVMEMLKEIQPFIKPVEDLIKLERLLHGLSTGQIDANMKSDYAIVVKHMDEYFNTLDDAAIIELAREAKGGNGEGDLH